MWRFFDRQIGMEPLVIDWAKEDLRLLLIILFLSRLCHEFFSQVNSTKGVLPNVILQSLKDS